MASLLTEGEKAELEAVRDDVFATFCREITCWVTPETTVLSSDSNYNYTYLGPDGDSSGDYVEYTPTSGTFQACINYDKKLERYFASPQGTRDENFRITFDDGSVRIKLRKEDYDSFIKDSINFKFDGFNFDLDKSPRPHGLFDPKYVTLFLKFRN
jgi:hypothetical protein